MIDVAANWKRVCREAAQAAERVGRDPRSVRVIAVSKTQPVERVEQVIAAGATDVGENYVQEAAGKLQRMAAPVRARATWHMVGHLQRNKAARAVELFDVVHTLDSAVLGAALARHAQQRGRRARVLIEVNVGSEPTKSGVPPSAVGDLLAALASEPWLEVDGLMTVPPAAPEPEAVRPFFRALRELRAQVHPHAPANAPLRELSMGMTDDFTVAIEEGATMVRIGRAIFGERSKREA